MICFRCIVSQLGTMAITKSELSLVSVIIPTRNRQHLLVKAIQSVINQTWRNIEIIVIDDASDDDTLAKVREIITDINIIVIHNESPKGGAVARNQGIERASGKYIAFLDDDDTWLPVKLVTQIELFEQSTGCSAVTCCYFEKYPEKKRKLIVVAEVINEQKMLESNTLGGASMYLTTKENLELIGGFNPALKSGQDWDLLIKLWSLGSILVCKQPLVTYLSHNEVRISNSYKSSYEGLKQIYFLYKSRMTLQTRYFHLAELMFYRVKLNPEGSFWQLRNFYKVLKRMTVTNATIFILRYMRFFLFQKQAKSI